jgi:hypothetical protein
MSGVPDLSTRHKRLVICVASIFLLAAVTGYMWLFYVGQSMFRREVDSEKLEDSERFATLSAAAGYLESTSSDDVSDIHIYIEGREPCVWYSFRVNPELIGGVARAVERRWHDATKVMAAHRIPYDDGYWTNAVPQMWRKPPRSASDWWWREDAQARVFVGESRVADWVVILSPTSGRICGVRASR